MNHEQAVNNDFLIAEYTLGLLNLQETAQAHALLGSDPEAVVKALKWEEKFLGLVDQLPPIAPPAHLLKRIQATLGQEITVVKSPRVWPGIVKNISGKTWSGIWFWRSLSLILALIALALLLRINKLDSSTNGADTAEVAAAQAPAVPLSGQLAILQAPGQSSTPGWILKLDTQNNLMLTPLVRSEVPVDTSVQLWTHNDTEPQPRSLGIIDPNLPVTIPAATVGNIQPGQLFEMTLEAQGGSPSNSPKGAILFIGRTVDLK